MFDLGMQELILIFLVAFLVFGPKRLPELGRTLGKGIRELKNALSNVKETIEESDLNVSKEIRNAKEGIEDSIKQSIDLGISKKDFEEKKAELTPDEDANKTSHVEKIESSDSEKDG